MNEEPLWVKENTIQLTWNIISLCYTMINIVVGTSKLFLRHNSNRKSRDNRKILTFQKLRKQYILK